MKINTEVKASLYAVAIMLGRLLLVAGGIGLFTLAVWKWDIWVMIVLLASVVLICVLAMIHDEYIKIKKNYIERNRT